MFSAYHHLVVEHLTVLINYTWKDRCEDWLKLLDKFYQHDIEPGIDSDGLLYAIYNFNTKDYSWQPVDKEVLTKDILAEQDLDIEKEIVGRFKTGNLSCFAANSVVEAGAAVENNSKYKELAEKILTSVSEDKLINIL
ncbi:MAG: hypothetical protein ACYTFY_22910, partial [Planctomycetota bacterium]